MKKIKSVLLLTTSLLLLSGSALAADEIQLTDINGEVMINQGEAYSVASQGMDVMPGDQLMVVADGLAKLTYPNGCVLTVTGEYILSVAASSPCAAGALVATVGGTAAAAGIGTGGIVGLSILGVAVAAAIIDEDDDDKVDEAVTPPDEIIDEGSSGKRPISQ